MSKKLNISFDSDLFESISADFDLRAPNKEALRQLIFTLDGDYDPSIMQVLNLATGVGKTYLMAAFVEYLRRQGVNNVVIVTPGKTVQAKTVQNFTPGSSRYIEGSALPPDVVTPQDYSAWVARQNSGQQYLLGNEYASLAFIFNIQQLIAPKSLEGETHGSGSEAQRRRPRRFDENAGVLFDYLKSLDDLVVIADESHLYSVSAAAFHSALKELDPAACIGLTASASNTDQVIYTYPLYRAIEDKYVKAPVLAFRKNGYGQEEGSEEQQLRDAMQLRNIKQNYYDAYTQTSGKKHLNAVMFVVCSDVDHATQVTSLLRSPEYFDSELAVLQVDSAHEDDLTLRLLENLDASDSPVLAVVSVNKLKEGWDVKNIAVIVTLRAMASEVLTQQTMGRGLRLPFGAYTGVWQIDQLDIIAHQSFQELLEAENVLAQFGLEQAVKETNKQKVDEAIQRLLSQQPESSGDPATSQASDVYLGTGNDELNRLEESSNASYTIPDSGESGEDALSPGAHAGGDSDTDQGKSGEDALSLTEDKPSVSVRVMTESDPLPQLSIVTVEVNERFKEVAYAFPATTMSVQTPQFTLADIDNSQIEQAARRVTSTGDILHRKAIVAALGKKLKTQDQESAEVDSIHIRNEEASEALLRLVMNMSTVPKTQETKRYVENYLVPQFMRMAPIDHWTVKSLDSAQRELGSMISRFIEEQLRAIKHVPEIHPQKMPGDGFTLPLGEKIHEQVDSREEFKVHRYYGGWFKSLFEVESFDSYSGEYVLAKLLNTSPSIVWWQRLHMYSKAFIYYTPKDRYYPDFIAYDKEGRYWIIEGKDERGRDDTRVQAKRKAAETLVRRLVATSEFSGQKWGYLIAYENDTATAESWDDLKAKSQPITN